MWGGGVQAGKQGGRSVQRVEQDVSRSHGWWEEGLSSGALRAVTEQPGGPP